MAPTALGSYTFTIPASVVQGWLNAPSSNNGIVLADTTNDDWDSSSAARRGPPRRNSPSPTPRRSDTTPPETSIDSGPSGTVQQRLGELWLLLLEAGSTFECKLDGGTFAPLCFSQDYTGLSEGSHTFSVRAKDAAGNVDATPATRTWTVDTSTQTDPVLVGAGDIASCQSSGDEATANLLDGISGTVFTLGDNVYEDGTASEFR